MRVIIDNVCQFVSAYDILWAAAVVHRYQWIGKTFEYVSQLRIIEKTFSAQIIRYSVYKRTIGITTQSFRKSFKFRAVIVETMQRFVSSIVMWREYATKYGSNNGYK